MIMSELTCQAESELSALIADLKRAFTRIDDPAADPEARAYWVKYKVKCSQLLGLRAAVLLPVLLDELRSLRSKDSYHAEERHDRTDGQT
jgi:hypothetical protein